MSLIFSETRALTDEKPGLCNTHYTKKRQIVLNYFIFPLAVGCENSKSARRLLPVNKLFLFPSRHSLQTKPDFIAPGSFNVVKRCQALLLFKNKSK